MSRFQDSGERINASVRSLIRTRVQGAGHKGIGWPRIEAGTLFPL